ncbi:MAG: hypothetical protein RI842_11085 [Schleiferiaceae bacterium]|jgi:predicted nucleic acid-binding protein|nr:hypothetical protein [Schleiferiaceae bacterium]
MRVVVNDANVLIDLAELRLLPHFFALEMEFHTTSIILEELYEEQVEALTPFIENGSLLLHEVTEEELEEILAIRIQKPSLSEQDCSALYIARAITATLLTSDNTLRKFAKTQAVDVHGHFWILDRMVEAQTISPITASEKLTELCETVNPKLGLPKWECDKRHRMWVNS